MARRKRKRKEYTNEETAEHLQNITERSTRTTEEMLEERQRKLDIILPTTLTIRGK